MYIYKKIDNCVKLVDTIDTTDEYEIEERIIKIVKGDSKYKKSYTFLTKFTGIYTIYDAGLNFTILTSEYLLNKDGSISDLNSNRAENAT